MRRKKNKGYECIFLRVSENLYSRVVEAAGREGLSINRYLTGLLEGYIPKEFPYREGPLPRRKNVERGRYFQKSHNTLSNKKEKQL